jgi:NADH-quinone oxidoreductase subunit C
MFTFDDLITRFQGFNFERFDVNGTIGAIFSRERLPEIAHVLKEEFGFTHFIDAFGTDSNERLMRFAVIYNIRNPQTKERIFLKVRCDERDLHVPSVVSIWSGANWHERETYDMYGIVFDGHPDMRRMYMPDDYDYYPLRKDFPLMGIEGSTPLPKGSEMATRLN